MKEMENEAELESRNWQKYNDQIIDYYILGGFRPVIYMNEYISSSKMYLSYNMSIYRQLTDGKYKDLFSIVKFFDMLYCAFDQYKTYADQPLMYKAHINQLNLTGRQTKFFTKKIRELISFTVQPEISTSATSRVTIDETVIEKKLDLESLFINKAEYDKVINKLISFGRVLKSNDVLHYIPRRKGTKYEPEALRQALNFKLLLDTTRQLTNKEITTMLSNTFEGYYADERTLRSASISKMTSYFMELLK
jgi:hypothetical protein